MAFSRADPLLTPPGLVRLSSWPTRHHRRHAATIEFNSTVLTSLESMHDRLGVLDSKLTNLESRMSTATELENRVSSMELLLFRRTFAEFTRIDDMVTNINRTVSETPGSDQKDVSLHNDREPEILSENIRPDDCIDPDTRLLSAVSVVTGSKIGDCVDTASLSSTESYHASLNDASIATDTSTKAEWYDISDHIADASTQTADCEALASPSSRPDSAPQCITFGIGSADSNASDARMSMSIIFDDDGSTGHLGPREALLGRDEVENDGAMSLDAEGFGLNIGGPTSTCIVDGEALISEDRRDKGIASEQTVVDTDVDSKEQEIVDKEACLNGGIGAASEAEPSCKTSNDLPILDRSVADRTVEPGRLAGWAINDYNTTYEKQLEGIVALAHKLERDALTMMLRYREKINGAPGADMEAFDKAFAMVVPSATQPPQMVNVAAKEAAGRADTAAGKKRRHNKKKGAA